MSNTIQGTIEKEYRQRFNHIVEKFQGEVRGIRASRPSPELIEHLTVSYYDQDTPLKQIGTIGAQPPRDLVVTAWDKNAVAAIVKALEGAGLGLTVSSEGTVVRATLSPLTRERREEYMKLVKKSAEEARIQVRGSRDEVVKKLKAAQEAHEITEDDLFTGKEALQEAVNDTNKRIEEVVENKLKELAE